MASIHSFRVKHEEFEYAFDFSWNDDEFAEQGSLSFDIKAERRQIIAENEYGETQELEASITVSRDEETGDVRLKIDIDGQTYFDDVVQVVDGVEGFIESIPAELLGDPFIGCVVRSAISVVAGQVLECRSSALEDRDDTDAGRFWRLFENCLRRSIKRMGVRLVWRTGRCIVLIGQA